MACSRSLWMLSWHAGNAGALSGGGSTPDFYVLRPEMAFKQAALVRAAQEDAARIVLPIFQLKVYQSLASTAMRFDMGSAVEQAALVRAAEEGAARKAFDLALPALGPYALDWTRNGRFLLLGGRRGHLALLDWQSAKLLCEVQVRLGP